MAAAAGGAMPLVALAHLRLGYVQTTVLRALVQAYPARAGSDALAKAVYDGAVHDLPLNLRATVRQAVKSLRVVLPVHGWTVSLSERGPLPGAWRLEPLAAPLATSPTSPSGRPARVPGRPQRSCQVLAKNPATAKDMTHG
jgi:hypothetical protein